MVTLDIRKIAATTAIICQLFLVMEDWSKLEVPREHRQPVLLWHVLL